MPYDDDATGASVKPSSIPTIEDIPAEYPLPHDASVWTQKMEDSLGPLLAVAKGKWPASALLCRPFGQLIVTMVAGPWSVTVIMTTLVYTDT